MNGLIRFSLGNPYAVVVFCLTLVVLGSLAVLSVPVDILPVYNKPAVQVLTFYSGMPASNIEKDITARMERWTGQSDGMEHQESRSIVGASIIRNYYRDGVDPKGALTQVNSLATAAVPNLPPGTLPPVILNFDPTGTTPVCIVALNSKQESETTLYDVGRYEVRNYIMSSPGAISPVVYGGKMRAVLAYLKRHQLMARGLSPLDVMHALDNSNIFLPTGDAKFGAIDYALDSNSMFELVDRMGDIPIRSGKDGEMVYLRDVASPRDAALIQTTVVRVDGRRQVYVPVYRQGGASTLTVVENLRKSLPEMQQKLSKSDVNLKLVMDQSVFVRQSITSLATEGILGAVLCSLVILLFLGQFRMTMIAVLSIPLAVLSACLFLYASGQTLNVMTLAGLALAIGPLVDSAIICLENTERHLALGATPKDAAYLGASEVAIPELVAALCTLLVLAPLALMPGLGQFLFKPLALAVAFAMGSAYILSRTFVPMMCAFLLKGHGHHGPHAHEEVPKRGGIFGRAFRAWEGLIELAISGYSWTLRTLIMRIRLVVILVAVVIFGLVVAGLGPQLKREFYPEVDAGAFQIFVRAPSGTRIEETELRIADVEGQVRKTIGHDLDLIISELGVTADWSAAYTPNAGPMDAVVKVQLKEEREKSAQEYVHDLRTAFASNPTFGDLDFSFDAGGMIRSALNEGRASPINVRVTTKDLHKGRALAERIMEKVREVDGVVDTRILQRLDYPEFVLDVDRAKAAQLGLTQIEIMKNVVSAFNSSIQFNKKNFWIDPVTHNQYFVGVQYPEGEIISTDTLLNIPITSPKQDTPIPLRNIATLTRVNVSAEVTHANLLSTVDLEMGVHGRDLGRVSDDVAAVIGRFGKKSGNAEWLPYDPADPSHSKTIPGSKITLSGEYTKMQTTFHDMGIGLVLAVMLVYFLMVALFKSYITPLVIILAVPLGLVGVVLMLLLSGTALSVQSLLGIIFMVGIVVSNTVLLTDFAKHIEHGEGLSPQESIVKAASIRVRPVVMTAAAAFFALVPMSLGLERGSEANVPLGRAVLGGLLAGLITTLVVVPCLYSLMVRGEKHTPPPGGSAPSHDGHPPEPALPPAVANVGSHAPHHGPASSGGGVSVHPA